MGIEANDACPRYLARIVRGVEHRPAPLLAQARIVAAGMRPIDAVVDATNYTMLELGQPLHGFDLARLAGPAIVVRRAADGEHLRTLDDVDRTSTDADLLICDADGPIALAGVMGGQTSEVTAETRDVLLESATFTRGGISSPRAVSICIRRRPTGSSAAPTRRGSNGRPPGARSS